MAIIATWLAMGVTAAASAGTLEDLNAAHERGDYPTEIRLLRPLADKGMAVAQYNLATMYANGLGVSKDLATAMMWYRRAADQGNADAQGRLHGSSSQLPQRFSESRPHDAYRGDAERKDFATT